MYQIKFQNGYEIQCIGRGEKGLSRVANSRGEIVFTGPHDECEKWLADRGVQSLSAASK